LLGHENLLLSNNFYHEGTTYFIVDEPLYQIEGLIVLENVKKILFGRKERFVASYFLLYDVDFRGGAECFNIGDEIFDCRMACLELLYDVGADGLGKLVFGKFLNEIH